MHYAPINEHTSTFSGNLFSKSCSKEVFPTLICYEKVICLSIIICNISKDHRPLRPVLILSVKKPHLRPNFDHFFMAKTNRVCSPSIQKKPLKWVPTFQCHLGNENIFQDSVNVPGPPYREHRLQGKNPSGTPSLQTKKKRFKK